MSNNPRLHNIITSYSYDKNGNRASAKVYGKQVTASYTLDDQLEVYGNNTYRYDNDGYMIEKITPDGTTTYEYGTLGELKQVVTPTQTIAYKHNANNQRVAKLINGEVVEKYLWANLTTLLAIYDKDDNLVQRFEYANNRMPISMIQNNQKYYLHYDQIGTLKAVLNASQKIIKKITYDTYGNIRNETNKDFKVPFGFAGGLYDHNTKLTRFGYRDYDAYTGKWTAKDPIDFGGGDSNLYGYVLQDPVNFIDPTGKIAWIIPVIEGILAGGTGIGIGWGYSYHSSWQDNYDERERLLSEQLESIDKWCKGNSIGATEIACFELYKEYEEDCRKSALPLTQSAGQLPGIQAGGPAPTDIFAPVIGETINEVNN